MQGNNKEFSILGLDEEVRSLFAILALKTVALSTKHLPILRLREDGMPSTGKTTSADTLATELKLEPAKFGRMFRAIAAILMQRHNSDTEYSMDVLQTINSFTQTPDTVQILYKDNSVQIFEVRLLDSEDVAKVSGNISNNQQIVEALERDHLHKILGRDRIILEGRDTYIQPGDFHLTAHLSVTKATAVMRSIDKERYNKGRNLALEEIEAVTNRVYERGRKEETRSYGRVLSVEEALKEQRYNLVVDTSYYLKPETAAVIALALASQLDISYKHMARILLSWYPGVMKVGTEILDSR